MHLARASMTALGAPASFRRSLQGFAVFSTVPAAVRCFFGVRVVVRSGALPLPYFPARCPRRGFASQGPSSPIVATNEAHDSGLCAAGRATRARFAQDLRNLTLASSGVNRREKSGKDAAEWIPDRNRCWFAGRVLEVKLAYGLTVDHREAAALERILRGCASTAMEPMVCRTEPASAGDTGRGAGNGNDALARYDDNRNGRITCKEARRHGIAPVPRSHPAYRYMRDGDADGVVCE